MSESRLEIRSGVEISDELANAGDVEYSFLRRKKWISIASLQKIGNALKGSKLNAATLEPIVSELLPVLLGSIE